MGFAHEKFYFVYHRKSFVRQSFFRFENRALIGVGEAHRGGGVLGEGEMLNKAKCNVLRFDL